MWPPSRTRRVAPFWATWASRPATSRTRPAPPHKRTAWQHPAAKVARRPPARRNVNDVQVQRGQALFAQAQCATCHRPSYVTKEGPFPTLTSKALNGQRIWPYTDLLLHDMGERLADNRPDFGANGRQWKTPALWGTGLIKDVNGHTRLLHD